MRQGQCLRYENVRDVVDGITYLQCIHFLSPLFLLNGGNKVVNYVNGINAVAKAIGLKQCNFE